MAVETRQVELVQPDEQLELLARKGMGVLSTFFDNPDESPAALQAARIASSLIASWTRNRQVLSAKDALTFQMARELARDKEELRKYIEVSMPASGIARALPGK